MTDNSVVSDPNSLYLRNKIKCYTIVCQEYLHFILFLKYNEMGSYTTQLSSGIFTFYFIS
jgi:hypothetical protein